MHLEHFSHFCVYSIKLAGRTDTAENSTRSHSTFCTTCIHQEIVSWCTSEQVQGLSTARTLQKKPWTPILHHELCWAIQSTPGKHTCAHDGRLIVYVIVGVQRHLLCTSYKTTCSCQLSWCLVTTSFPLLLLERMKLPQNTKTCKHQQWFSSRGAFLTLQCPSLLLVQFYPLCPHLCLSPEEPVCVIAIYKQEG